MELGAAQDKLSQARMAADRDEMVTARRLAQQAALDAELANAKARTRKAELAVEELNETIEMLRAEARESAREAERSRAIAEAALAEADQMGEELEEMKAEQTARGLVLTLSDVLFDTGQAELKQGSMMAMDRLANFMKDNPERNLMIEGHTDARGSEQLNAELSSRRANAVALALTERGIASDRLRTIGLGEGYPVASNDTAAGMQQNRRVEVVISDRNGSFPEAAERRMISQH